MGLIALMLVLLNLDVYRFFLRKRGWWFACGRCWLTGLTTCTAELPFSCCLATHFIHLLFSVHPRCKRAEGR